MPEAALRVAVVGARANRQGTGEYIAGAFFTSGCDVCAIVGTSNRTAEAAQQALLSKHHINCNAYTSLDTLCQQEKPDIVAICSPQQTHYSLIRTALNAGCHVFCEKPLWWQENLHCTPASEILDAVHGITDQCTDSDLLLKLNTQWPFTLPAFRQLHSNASLNAADINNFSMWMSPASTGRHMITDAAPHLLSMLYALTGGGSLHNVEISELEKNMHKQCTRLLLQCVHEHHEGRINVDFLLTQHTRQPRPAGYRINGHSVERFVEMPRYLLSFIDADRRVPLKDPLVCAVEDFLGAVRSGQKTDSEALIFGMMQLHMLMSASDFMEY